MDKERINPEITDKHERAKVIWNNHCQRCGKILVYDSVWDGICDDCVTEVNKARWDKINL